ncbi:hypothetical protein TPHA_0M00770 [Tetrapisispora phaffii CBS 4417]|uniref:Ras-GAP domain-containing protein n=1 Tax=Tetrapisispora phaffii (strain ATCC 24235 / CBS 4417 / NBRC 1672 / NRRL Y-8282 / UCD 70-5) TaxID=1071381 RepID=G8C0D7_TETPH|nr:hypothetical protein TPHA_0M00770 [Tetrapisispora phaffii CBS 4417]CCE65652.1 hypothetical protein TPHA_0M00770 [Tetrapisispora phaffii CBS 4417]
MAHTSKEQKVPRVNMSDRLCYNVICDRIYQFLPVKSSFTYYTQVEEFEVFLKCRDILLTVVAKDRLHHILIHIMNCIEKKILTNNMAITEVTFEQFQSIIVLMRLLNDLIEYNWDMHDMKQLKASEQKKVHQLDNAIFRNRMVGFASSRTQSHSTRPSKLPTDNNLIHRLLNFCNNLKFHTSTINTLLSSSDDLYGQHLHLRFMLLANYQEILKKNSLLKTDAILLDVTIAHLQSFLAASNPDEYSLYLNEKLLQPYFAHIHSPNEYNHQSARKDEFELIKYFDLFASLQITSRDLIHFLEIVEKLSTVLGKTIFNTVFISHVTKTLQIWITSKPNDFLTFNKMHQNEKRLDRYEIIESLFDQLFSTYKVSSLLTSNFARDPIIPTSSAPIQINSTSVNYNISEQNTSLNPFSKSNSRSSTGTSTNNPHINPLQPVGLSRTSSMNILNQENQSLKSHAKNNTLLNSYERLFFDQNSSNSSIQTNNIKDEIKGDSSNELDNSHLFSYINRRKSNTVLTELIGYNNSYTSSNLAILNILGILAILQNDVMIEASNISLTDINDHLPSNIDQSKGPCYSDSTNKQTDNDSLPTTLNKIKSLSSSIRSFKRNPPKKKTIKFLTLLVKNLNGSSSSSEVALLDSSYVLLSMLFLASTVSTIDVKAPAVFFCCRFINTFGQNLQVGRNWNDRVNKAFSNFEVKYPHIFKALQLKYFISLLQMDTNNFIAHLCLEDVLRERNLTVLCLYTEGFSLYFHTNLTNKISKESNVKTHAFLIELFYMVIKMRHSTIIGENALKEIFRKHNKHVENIFKCNLQEHKTVISKKRDFYFGYDSNLDISDNDQNDNELITLSSNPSSVQQQMETISKYSYKSIRSKTPVSVQSSIISNEVDQNEVDLEIMVSTILTIFSRKIYYFFTPENVDSIDLTYIIETNLCVVKIIADGYFSTNDAINKSSRTFVKVFLEFLTNINKDSPVQLIVSAYFMTTGIVFMISKLLTNLSLSYESREVLLQAALQFMNTKYYLTKLLQDNGRGYHISLIVESQLNDIAAVVGKALFLSLCCGKPKIQQIVTDLYKSYYKFVLLYGEIIGRSDEELDIQLDFIRSLSSANYILMGNIAFQHYLLDTIMKHLQVPNRILVESIFIIYDRWLYLSQNKLALTQDQFDEFRIFAGVIAVSSGIILSQKTNTDNYYIKENINSLEEKFNYFIVQQCIWINDSSLLTRENARDILSHELHPLAYNILLTNIKKKFDEISKSTTNVILDDYWYSFIEQVIIILRTILQKDDDATKKNLILVSVEIIDIIEFLCIHIKNIPASNSKFHKIVIQMLKLFKGIQSSENKMFIKCHFQLKNKWLKFILEIFNDSVNHDFDFNNITLSHKDMDLDKRKIDSLFIDRLLESSITLKYLTKNLPIEVIPSSADNDLRKLKATEFGKYFSYLFKGLEICHIDDNIPHFLSNKKTLISSNIIASLANLTNANSDVGIEYALPLGLSLSREMKMSFLKVFINIIQSEKKYNQHEDEHNKIIIFTELTKYFQKFPFLISDFCKVCPSDIIDEFSVGIFEAFGATTFFNILFKELLSNEISTILRPSEILRRNSCTTSILTLFASSRGHEYLVDVLKPALSNIVCSNDLMDIEKLDPDDPETGHKVSIYLSYFDKIVESIIGSQDIFPESFFDVCKSIYDVTTTRFRDHGEIAVSAFLFLRFICPSIITPETESIESIFDTNKKKVCLSMAKLLQMIANGSDSLTRWPSLKNEINRLTIYREKIFSFIKSVSTKDKIIQNDTQVSTDLVPNLAFLQKVLYFNELSIRKTLLKDVQCFGSVEEFINLIEIFDTFMGKFKQPNFNPNNDLPQYVKEHMYDMPRLYNFMEKNVFKKKNSTIIYKNFITESISSDNIPTITVSFRHLQYYSISNDEMVYHFIQTYSKIWTTKNYLVFDCTDYCSDGLDSLVPFLTLLLTLIPEETLKLCVSLYVINADSSAVDQALKGGSNVGLFLAAYGKQKWITSNEDGNIIKFLGTKGETLEIVKGVRIFLKDVLLYDHDSKKSVAVALQIGTNHIQVLIQEPKKIKLTDTSTVTEIKVNHVYHISRILSVDISSYSGNDSEFTIALDSGSVTLCCDKYLDVIRMINQSMSRIEEDASNQDNLMSRPESVVLEEKDKEINKRYIVSNLLIILLLGFSDDDMKIKEVSYNLMVALQNTYKMDFGFFLYTSPEIYVSQNGSQILTEVTKTLVAKSSELTPYIIPCLLNLLESDILDFDDIPTYLSYLSAWMHNVYQHIYIADLNEDGVALTTKIIHRVIRLTVKHEAYSSLYIDNIWHPMLVELQFINIVVDETLVYASERLYENKDKNKVLNILGSLPTFPVAKIVIGKLLDIINSFSHSLIYEASNKSWSDLLILSKLASDLFFQNTLVAQNFLPETLIIISLLIDLGPLELRETLFGLLMNVCNSLAINNTLPSTSKKQLDSLCQIFVSHRLRFIYGFSQNKNRILPRMSAESFQVNFKTLEYFIDNILLLMENYDGFESAHWKASYKSHIINILFNKKTLLSARAVMILGIVNKSKTPEYLTKRILYNMMLATAEPDLSEEQLFLSIAHVHTCSKLVEGLDPSLEIMKSMFWLSTTYVISEHPLFFEAGLIFLTNNIKRLFMVELHKGKNGRPLIDILLETKGQLQPQYSEIEKLVNFRWDKHNFTYILLWTVSRGLSFPHIKEFALFCLVQLFRNTYYEFAAFKKDTHYLSYYLFVFVTMTPSQLEDVINAVEYEEEEEFYQFDSTNKVTKHLLDWLVSDNEDTMITLYQIALIYRNLLIDDAGKFRFGLIMKYLLEKNPVCVLPIYNIIQPELFNQLATDKNILNSDLAFEIIGLVSRMSEFNKASKYEEELLETLGKRDLRIINSLTTRQNESKLFFDPTNLTLSSIVAEEKKYTIRLISKIIQNSDELNNNISSSPSTSRIS